MAPPVHVLSIATAVPPHQLDQHAVADAAREVYARTFTRFPRLAEVFTNAGIERRYSVRPLEWLSKPHDWAERTDAYLEGLRTFGWHGDEDDVRFAALTTASVQMLSFAACHIAWLCPDFGEVDRWPEDQAEKQFSDVDTIMDSWCEVVRFLLTLAERAMR